MTASSNKQRSFPWKRGSLLLILLIGAVVAFDCRKHGSFEASSTGRLLKSSGVCEYTTNVLAVTKSYSDKGLAYLESVSPEYYKVVADYTKQYTKLAGDVYLVGRNSAIKGYNNVAGYIDEKRLLALASIEEYFPGWQETLYTESKKQFEAASKHLAALSDYIVEKSTTFIRWLQTSVFVGDWSPENIKSRGVKMTEGILTYASQTYDWLYEKVQTFSKVQ